MTIDDYREFIVRPSLLRMLQIGQRGIMRLLWVPLEKGDESITHVDPHPFSMTGLWLQSDILSILQGSSASEKEWFEPPVEPRERYTSRIRLADANRYTVEPSMFTSPIGLYWINFEVFVLDYMASADHMYDLASDIRSLFEQIWGRCEVRLGQDILFLDFNVHRHTDVSQVFGMLHIHLYMYEIVLHRGKAQVPTHPFTPFLR